MSTRTEQGWVPVVDSFGARLALLRHHCGWNLKQAAIECGVPAQSWRQWEVAGRRPHDYVDVCKRIAQRTNADMHWLAFGSTPRPQILDWSDLRSIAATDEQDESLNNRRG